MKVVITITDNQDATDSAHLKTEFDPPVEAEEAEEVMASSPALTLANELLMYLAVSRADDQADVPESPTTH